MTEFEGLPDSRTSLRGLTEEGHEAWLIRAVAGKLYRCPGYHVPELRGIKPVRAAASTRSRLETRAPRPAGRRQRR